MIGVSTTYGSYAHPSPLTPGPIQPGHEARAPVGERAHRRVGQARREQAIERRRRATAHDVAEHGDARVDICFAALCAPGCAGWAQGSPALTRASTAALRCAGSIFTPSDLTTSTRRLRESRA